VSAPRADLSATGQTTPSQGEVTDRNIVRRQLQSSYHSILSLFAGGPPTLTCLRALAASVVACAPGSCFFRAGWI